MTQMMMKIPEQQAIAYPITIDENLLTHPEKWLSPHFHTKKIVIITDSNVNELYGKILATTLKAFEPLLLTFASGEQSKNNHTKHLLEKQMLQHYCTRDTVILALGGGVVGDLSGFIAATYMRGIPYLMLPTTLLAMVDSSVGGKTGINTAEGKNLIGAFWQPSAVLIDVKFLKTLPQEHIINGLIEALKMFMTNDIDSLKYLSDNLHLALDKDLSILNNTIARALKIKMAVVSSDEKESHQRMILNFGHTIGHALEKITNYTLLHGYAVALGILIEAKIAQLSGILSGDDYQTIRVLFKRLNITGQPLKNINREQLILATQQDKKNTAGSVRYVLLKKLGQVYTENNSFIHAVCDEVVNQAFDEVSEES